MSPALADVNAGALYLSVSVNHFRELVVALPKVDVRLPGSTRPAWRWRYADLDALIGQRLQGAAA